VTINVVCEKCFKNNADPIIEINFSDKCIYYTCLYCKNNNKMSIKKEDKPLAKPRRL